MNKLCQVCCGAGKKNKITCKDCGGSGKHHEKKGLMAKAKAKLKGDK